MKLTTILLLLPLATQAQKYAAFAVGTGAYWHKAAGTVSVQGGYTLQTDRINFYAEISATYYTSNKASVSLMAGSTVLTPHLVVLGGVALTSRTVMGKYQLVPENYISPCGAIWYEWSPRDMAADLFVRGFASGSEWSLGVGIVWWRLKSR